MALEAARAAKLRAVLFDVDFTLAKPGPELMPEGYVRCGERHGLDARSGALRGGADAALVDLQRHPELDHDEEIWVAFTERIVLGMGGSEPASREVAVELTRRWEQHENFELYEDAMPVLDELRSAGLKIGLVSNSARDVDAFAVHHALDVDAGDQLVPRTGRRSRTRRSSAPCSSCSRSSPTEAVMVGDTVEDDIEGALAIGMRARPRRPARGASRLRARLDDLWQSRPRSASQAAGPRL